MTSAKQNAKSIDTVTKYGIDPYVRIDFVVTATSLSRSTVYRLVAAGKFPKPCHPTQFTTAWRLSDVQTWLDEREQQSPCRIRINP